MTPERADTPVLVVGGGAAGMRAAITAAQAGARVTLASDGPPGKTGNSYFLELLAENTAVVGGTNAQQVESHYQNLLALGAGVNDPALARLFAEQCAEEIATLTRLGLVAPLEPQAGGSAGPAPANVNVRVPRGFGDGLLHVLRGQIEASGVQVWNGLSLKGICPSGDGGWALFSRRQAPPLLVSYRALVLATGGVGGLYSLSTNPRNLKGHALGAFLLAGGQGINLEFLQYFPLSVRPWRGYFFASRVLVKGTISCGRCGHELFTPATWSVDPRLFVFRDVCLEMARHDCPGPFHWRLVERQGFSDLVPRTWRIFAGSGAPMDTTPLQIGIGAHHLVGGIRVDRRTRSSIPGIYAAGEIMGGVQGADRMGGSGIPEGLVFGRLAGDEAARWSRGAGAVPRPDGWPGPWADDPAHPKLQAWRRELTRVLEGELVYKDEASLLRARDAVRGLRSEAADPVAGNRSLALETVVAEAMLCASLPRRETRGAFRRRDYQDTDPQLARPSLLAWDRANNEPVLLRG